jgi:hypothetical protein
MTLVNGSLKTLKAYAWPIERWTAKAAGGINHLLKPGPAVILSFDKKPLMAPPLPSLHFHLSEREYY